MLGIAQRLFIEKHGNHLWDPCKGNREMSDWPILEAMMAAKRLTFVDLAIAERILSKAGCKDEACASIICHLSLAAREGHLCAKIDDGGIYPPLEDVWKPTESLDKEMNDEMAKLGQLIVSGASRLPSVLLFDADVDKENSLKPVYKQNKRYYLQRYWLLENAFIDSIKSLLQQSSPRIALDMGYVQAALDRLLHENKLLPEQASAIAHTCRSTLTIITGGPGTGKTHTAGNLLRICWEAMTLEQRSKCKIELAAPTGKAAANLEASINRALQDIESFPKVQAKTLHSLIGMKQLNSSQGIHKILQADVLIVDECSMIDARMMSKLLSSIRPGARLVLLGDTHQLPPVESGSMFADLVELMSADSTLRPNITELKKCLRSDLKTIVDLAERIRQGDTQGAFELLNGSSEGCGIRYVALQDQSKVREIQQKLLSYAVKYFPPIDTVPSHLSQTLKDFARFRVLTPLRKGPLGVEMLNRLIFQDLKSRMRGSQCLIVPIMVSQNHQQLGIFNGEIGLLVSHPHGDRSQDYALFEGRKMGESVRKISALMLPKYEYAYCLSIHKSQGSEFDHVIVLLPEDSESAFGRETLYTGVTRARRILEIWASPISLHRMIGHTSKRYSGIGDRL